LHDGPLPNDQRRLRALFDKLSRPQVRRAARALLLPPLLVAGYHDEHAPLWNGYSMRPWRSDARSYLDGLPRGSATLRGTPANAVWDSELSTAIAQHAVRIEEEVLPDLLADLARPAWTELWQRCAR
jgi:hypothetical protein